MRFSRGRVLLLLGTWFLILYISNLFALSSPQIFQWTQETLAGTVVFFLWGTLLSFIFLAFCLAFLIKHRRGLIPGILLMLHALYVFPCVALEIITFEVSTRFAFPEEFLGLLWTAISIVFASLALHSLAFGKLAALMEEVPLVLRCALILPLGLSVWNLSLMILLNLYMI